MISFPAGVKVLPSALDFSISLAFWGHRSIPGNAARILRKK